MSPKSQNALRSMRITTDYLWRSEENHSFLVAVYLSLFSRHFNHVFYGQVCNFVFYYVVKLDKNRISEAIFQ